MRNNIAYSIMRTTLDIDEPVLKELKAAQKSEGKSLGRLVSDLLAVVLAERRRGDSHSLGPMKWESRPMGARVDLADREAAYDLMDGDGK